jgi:hypothetical protein
LLRFLTIFPATVRYNNNNNRRNLTTLMVELESIEETNNRLNEELAEEREEHQLVREQKLVSPLLVGLLVLARQIGRVFACVCVCVCVFKHVSVCTGSRSNNRRAAR